MSTNATSRTIRLICEHCSKEYDIQGSYDYQTYILRLSHARCPHCKKYRSENVIMQYFKCGKCKVIYRKTRVFRPKRGFCPACYQIVWRTHRDGEVGNAEEPDL